MASAMTEARAKIFAGIEALKNIRLHQSDPATRAELQRAIEMLELGEMRLNAAVLEMDTDERCHYCGAPPGEQKPSMFGFAVEECPQCGADIPIPPQAQHTGPSESDIGY
jgi:hypothetical protein